MAHLDTDVLTAAAAGRKNGRKARIKAAIRNQLPTEFGSTLVVASMQFTSHADGTYAFEHNGTLRGTLNQDEVVSKIYTIFLNIKL